MATTPEGKVKAKVKKVLKAHGVWYYMPMQNGMGQVGIPDFVCCHRGLFLAIETKAPGKGMESLTANQRARRADILDAKGRYLVISDVADLESALGVHQQRGWFTTLFNVWKEWADGQKQKPSE